MKKLYRVTVTLHCEDDSAEHAIARIRAEFTHSTANISILAQNVDAPCDCTFVGPNFFREEVA